MKYRHISAEEVYQLYLDHPEVNTDSRHVTPGSIFFALRGENHNGNTFAAKALQMGASYVIIDDPAYLSDPRCLLTDNTLALLQDVARLHRKRLTGKVLAITGSNGKTTTKELVHAVISLTYRTIATVGNLNNHIGVPLTLLRTPVDTEVLIVEMGANHQGEIGLLCDIAQPSMGIITNIGKAHLEGFGGIEGVKRAKGELFDYLSTRPGSTVLYHSDDPVVAQMAQATSAHLFSYGTAHSDVNGTPVSDSLHLALQWHDGLSNPRIQTRLVGSYNFSNVMAAIAAGVLMDVDPEGIPAALEEYQPVNSRSQLTTTDHNTIVLDCYNANPSSMQESIHHFSKHLTGKGCLILGDMLELGDYATEEHHKVAKLAKETGCLVILVGAHFSDAAPGIADHMFSDVDQLRRWLADHPMRGYHILVKGSRGIRMERAVELL
jgi:UDP-N-acetylmuramoyl-tripeptide--D-alanyl-D-alanine ligase